MKVLGIETSCDETAIAVVNSDREIILNEIYSQVKIHAEYGGVIPELAARNHIEILPAMIKNAIESKKLNLNDIDAIAVTAGPGLICGVIVGVMIAKGLASGLRKPCIPVNHLEGHALTPRLTTPELEFPYLLLLVSGGHCQIILAKGVNNYEMLGSTKDDAVGEAFDKVAKMLGFEYPGGPQIEQLAKLGDPNSYDFPKAFFKEKHCDMSFSGIKTAVSRQIAKETDLSTQVKANICASFQDAITKTLCDRLNSAIQMVDVEFKHIVVSGGVAANQHICSAIRDLARAHGKEFIAPPIRLCTDNAAMIAWAGIEMIKSGAQSDLSFAPKSRMPLNCVTKVNN